MNLPSLIGHLLEVLAQFDATTIPADRIVAEFFRKRKYLGSHDRRFISDTFFGVIRHRRFFETLLEGFTAGTADASALTQTPARYLAIYFLYSFINDTADQQDRIVSSSYWETYFPGIDPDVFRKWTAQHSSLDFLGGDEESSWGARYSFPDWMMNDWKIQVGGETPALLDALNRQAPVNIRVNTLLTDRDACRRRLQSEGVETTLTVSSPVGLTATKRFNAQSIASFQEGWYEVQDEGSQLISILADPQPGTTVLDGCAGAGGKSLHLAEIMKNKGKIIALDIDQKKLTELESRARRGSRNIITSIVKSDDQIAALNASADLVLVDAPCSGTGTIRRNPGAKWRLTEDMMQQFSSRQLRLLSEFSTCLKTGGRLIYSTCSLMKRENDAVVDEFLKTHTQFIPCPSEVKIGGCIVEDPDARIHLYPHKTGTDGFFIATMKRVG